MKQGNRDSLTFVMLLFILMAVGAFFLLFTMNSTQDMPNCPTEDSCSIDYHDGAWHIEEIVP